MMSSNKQLDGQPLKGQFDQNPPNPLSHTSSGSYPHKLLNGPFSTMHKQGGVVEIFDGEIISST
jgi:hypothetical protein